MKDRSVTLVITTYQQRITAKPYIPSTTYGIMSPGVNGVPYNLFISLLFSYQNVGVQFLRMWGWFQTVWCTDSADYIFPGASTLVLWSFTDGDMRLKSVSPFRSSASSRHGTWFQQSNLKYMEFLLLTYIPRRVPAHTTQQELQFGLATITDGVKLCTKSMFYYVLGRFQKIVGPKNSAEIGDSKFGRRKYNSGHKVKCHWLFTGV